MFKKRFMLLSVLVILAMFIGCAKPPTEELAKADKAIADAKAKEANLYVQEAFQKAEGALKKAKDQVTAKQYKEAKQAAIDAANFAQQAVAGVEAAKTKMKDDATKMTEDAANALAELNVAVAAALKKKVAVPKEEVQSAIGKWNIELVEVKDKLQAGKISEAFNALKGMIAAVGAKKEEISSMEPAAPAKKK